MAHFLEAFPAAEGRPLQPLTAPQFTTSWFRNAHKYRCTFGRVHALGVWKVENLTVAGHDSHMFRDSERFTNSSIVPGYVEDLIGDGRVRPSDHLSLPERIIEEPVVVFMGWGKNVYGHSLIEAAPKIQIAAKALGEAPERLRFLLARDADDWFRQVATMAGARQFVECDQAIERVLLREAWVSTLPSDGAFHPACNGIYDAMRPPLKVVERDAFFITRRNAQVTRAISLNNADDIERRAERAGLRIVSPEQLPVVEQAATFANARLIVGEYGSALMNAVFCEPHTIVGAVGWRSRTLSAISALRRLRQSYFDPTGSPSDPAGYTVNGDAFSRWLEVLLETAETSLASRGD